MPALLCPCFDTEAVPPFWFTPRPPSVLVYLSFLAFPLSPEAACIRQDKVAWIRALFGKPSYRTCRPSSHDVGRGI